MKLFMSRLMSIVVCIWTELPLGSDFLLGEGVLGLYEISEAMDSNSRSFPFREVEYEGRIRVASPS